MGLHVRLELVREGTKLPHFLHADRYQLRLTMPQRATRVSKGKYFALMRS
jgi:hypothetical protein